MISESTYVTMADQTTKPVNLLVSGDVLLGFDEDRQFDGIRYTKPVRLLKIRSGKGPMIRIVYVTGYHLDVDLDQRILRHCSLNELTKKPDWDRAEMYRYLDHLAAVDPDDNRVYKNIVVDRIEESPEAVGFCLETDSHTFIANSIAVHNGSCL